MCKSPECVDRVLKVSPQLQATEISSYAGWVSVFIIFKKLVCCLNQGAGVYAKPQADAIRKPPLFLRFFFFIIVKSKDGRFLFGVFQRRCLGMGQLLNALYQAFFS